MSRPSTISSLRMSFDAVAMTVIREISYPAFVYVKC